MKCTTSRLVPESGIENVVSALMQKINCAICPAAPQNVIETISLVTLRAFQEWPGIKKEGRAAIAPGKTPEELRTYILEWKQKDDGYEFSFYDTKNPCTESEVKKGYEAMLSYFSEKGFPEF